MRSVSFITFLQQIIRYRSKILTTEIEICDLRNDVIEEGGVLC